MPEPPETPKVKHGYGESAVSRGLGAKMTYNDWISSQNTLHYYAGATPKVLPGSTRKKK